MRAFRSEEPRRRVRAWAGFLLAVGDAPSLGWGGLDSRRPFRSVKSGKPTLPWADPVLDVEMGCGLLATCRESGQRASRARQSQQQQGLPRRGDMVFEDRVSSLGPRSCLAGDRGEVGAGGAWTGSGMGLTHLSCSS